ncbi:MAG: NfeD family protein [Acidobacteriota bacterium]
MESNLLGLGLAWLAGEGAQMLLLSLGLLMLSLEVHLPGAIAPAIIGSAALGLAVGAGFLRGLVSPFELGVLGLGVMLLLVEVLVLPGFGPCGATGVSLMLVSAFLSLVSKNPSEDELRGALLAMLSCLLCGVVGSAVAAPRMGRVGGPLVLETRLSGTARGASRLEMVGERGVSTTDCRPAGKALLRGDVVHVLAEGGYIPRGRPVVVRAIKGRDLLVAEAADTSAAAA